MKKWLVIEPWTIVYKNPIQLKAGEEVIIDFTRREEDPEWQGWVWVRSHDYAGWVPVQVIGEIGEGEHEAKARITADYSAKEINATIGDVVTGTTIMNGWLWCCKTDTADFGWLPLKNLTEAD